MSTSENPKIIGQFTNWEPKLMTDLVSFCIANDRNPPDFLGELVEEDKIKSRQENLLDDDEKLLVL